MEVKGVTLESIWRFFLYRKYGVLTITLLCIGRRCQNAVVVATPVARALPSIEGVGREIAFFGGYRNVSG